MVKRSDKHFDPFEYDPNQGYKSTDFMKRQFTKGMYQQYLKKLQKLKSGWYKLHYLS